MASYFDQVADQMAITADVLLDEKWQLDMALFKLKGSNSDPHVAELEIAKPEKLGLEKNPWPDCYFPFQVVAQVM